MVRDLLIVLCAVLACCGLARGDYAQLVADINPGAGGGGASYLTIYGNCLYFTANDLVGGSDQELWRYDGSTVQRAADINPGPASSFPSNLTVYGSRLYLAASGPGASGRLWQFDGTAASPAPGSEPASAPQLDSFSEMIDYGGRLYFRGTRFGTCGTELWWFDGAQQQVIDLWPGTGSSGPKEFIEYNGRLYFNAVNQQLWRLNTAGDGAEQVSSIGEGLSPESPVVFGGALYFRGYEPATGLELYRYDGTTTTRVTDIAAGPAFGSPSGMTVFGDKIYFSADEGTHGLELWSYSELDGAQLVYNINQNAPPAGGEDPEHHANPSDFLVFDGRLYFGADDGVHGRELWCYDGAGEPELVADIYPGQYGSDVRELIEFQGRLFFSANNGTLGGEPAYLAESALFALVPEPATLALLAAGTCVLALRRRRR
jgi:ELWxxDGT repeat protein